MEAGHCAFGGHVQRLVSAVCPGNLQGDTSADNRRGPTNPGSNEQPEDVGVALLKANPAILPTLRMSTCPPLAVDRLIGLAGVSRNLVRVIERDRELPSRMPTYELDRDLERIAEIIRRMADPDIFVWLPRDADPTEQEV